MTYKHSTKKFLDSRFTLIKNRKLYLMLVIEKYTDNRFDISNHFIHINDKQNCEEDGV